MSLNPEILQVDTFEVEQSLALPDDGKCTGCPSGCGIIYDPELLP